MGCHRFWVLLPDQKDLGCRAKTRHFSFSHINASEQKNLKLGEEGKNLGIGGTEGKRLSLRNAEIGWQTVSFPTSFIGKLSSCLSVGSPLTMGKMRKYLPWPSMQQTQTGRTYLSQQAMAQPGSRATNIPATFRSCSLNALCHQQAAFQRCSGALLRSEVPGVMPKPSPSKMNSI